MKFFLFLLILLSLLIIRGIPQNFLPQSQIPEIFIEVDCIECEKSQLENDVFEPLREEILKISEVISVDAEANFKGVLIRVNYVFGTPLDQMKGWINESIDKVIDKFPSEISRPLVFESDFNTQPAASLILKSDQLGIGIIQEIERSLESLESVSSTQILGNSEIGYEIIPDYTLLGHLKIKPEDIKKSILHENQILSEKFELKESKRTMEFTLTSNPNFDLETVRVKNVSLGEIATIKKKEFFNHGEVVHNGEKSILIHLFKRPDIGFYAFRKEINDWLIHNFQDLEIKIERDYSGFILEALKGLKISFGIALILTFLLILFFYQNLEIASTTMLILLTSLALTLGVLGLFSFSINLISLTGLMFSTGLMIDNSIVLVDQLSEGSRKKFEVKKNTQSIFPAVLTSGLTTIGVFLPLIFIPGIIGYLLSDLVKTIGFGLLISLFVNFTVFPLFFQQLKFPSQKSLISKQLTNNYKIILNEFLSSKYSGRITYFLCFIISFLSLNFISFEWLPDLKNEYKSYILKESIIPYPQEIDNWTWISNESGSSELRIQGTIPENRAVIIEFSEDPLSKLSAFLNRIDYVLIPDSSKQASSDRNFQDLTKQLEWKKDHQFSMSNGKPILIYGSEKTKHPLQVEYPKGNWIYSSELENLPQKDESEILFINEEGTFIKTDIPKDSKFNSFYLGEIKKTALLGILILFLALFTHFKTIVFPLVLIAELPISIAGSLFFLWIGGSSLNIMSITGIVVSLGIVVNDSILKLDAIDQNLKKGINLMNSIGEAGYRRFLPIILTSLTTIIAILPSFFGNTSGHFMQYPLALSIAGGMIFSTFSSLFILPKWIIYLKSF
jgi:multidrug efflux pump subunit AcrB